MSTRKYLSEYEKLLKKRKIEKQIESQKGSMDKFVTNFLKKKTHNRKFGWKYYKWTRNLSKRVGR